MERGSTYKMLILNDLTKRFDGVHAVKNISFKVEKGDVYGFLGPNGAGKDYHHKNDNGNHST